MDKIFDHDSILTLHKVVFILYTCSRANLTCIIYFYTVLTIWILIGWETWINFGNQRNLQSSQFFASQMSTNLKVARTMHNLQEQCQTLFRVKRNLSLLFQNNV